jgi:RNase P/RNase MRP subunit POP5
MLEKKRYILYKVESTRKLTADEAKHLAYAALFEFLGEQGSSRAGTQFKAFSEQKQEGIVKCKPEAVEEVIAALAAKRFWNKEPVALRVQRVSGAIGNLIDRFRFGEVVDFLDFYIASFHWPAFNIADAAICAGIGLMAVELFSKDHKKTPLSPTPNRR